MSSYARRMRARSVTANSLILSGSQLTLPRLAEFAVIADDVEGDSSNGGVSGCAFEDLIEAARQRFGV